MHPLYDHHSAVEPGSRRRRGPLILVAAILILGLPAIALASHQFSDVPTSSPFHTNISQLVESGITAGCGSGKYCPKSEVTREQMAAFLTRGMGRTALGSNTIAFSRAEDLYVATVRISMGGASGGTGFVTVNANISAVTDVPDLCPCRGYAYLQDLATGETSESTIVPIIDNGIGDDVIGGNGNVTWVFDAPSNVNRTFGLAFDLDTTETPPPGAGGAPGTVAALFGTLTAQYSPFGSAGGDTLGITAEDRPTLWEPRPNKRQAP